MTLIVDFLSLLVLNDFDVWMALILKYHMKTFHCDILQHEDFLVFKTTKLKLEISYWYQLSFTFHFIFLSSMVWCSYNLNFCQNVPEIIKFWEEGGVLFFYNRTKAWISYAVIFCMAVQVVYMFFPFVVGRTIRLILIKLKYKDENEKLSENT